MTKGELRKQRQAEHATRTAVRLAKGDTRTAEQRHTDAAIVAAKRSRSRKRPVPGSLEWTEQRGGLIGGYETDDTYCPD